MELLFIINKGPAYGFGLQYTKSYSDANKGKIFISNKPEQPRTYYDIQNAFRDNVIFHKKLARGGNWTFIDKFRSIRFGVIGNPDVAHDDATDIFETKIIQLKDQHLKLEFTNDDGKKHTMTFEPRNPNAIK